MPSAGILEQRSLDGCAWSAVGRRHGTLHLRTRQGGEPRNVRLLLGKKQVEIPSRSQWSTLGLRIVVDLPVPRCSLTGAHLDKRTVMRLLYLDIDALRADHVGCYGYHRATTPNIDAMDAGGLWFANVYASDVPCLPSCAALMSGTHVAGWC